MMYFTEPQNGLHTMKQITTLFTAVLILLSACKELAFQNDLKADQKPWTDVPSQCGDNEFVFAIIGDLNGGERKGVFEIAAQQIKLLRPKFTLSIGDLIDGGSEDTVELKKQFDDFDARAAKTGAPFFHVGGNHDLTNLVMRKFWENRYGARYYHFIYNNVLFLMIDSEDYEDKRMMEIYYARKRAIELLDSGKTEIAEKSTYFSMPERKTGYMSTEQSEYFTKVIGNNPDVRWTFIFMHKPVWQNTGNGSLEKIETALKGRSYTVFNGHLHDYSYTKRNNSDYIMMATTGGGQNPKSSNSFDHVTLVTMSSEGPSIINLRLDGMLDKTGKIPLGGDTVCFQASKCDRAAAAH
jgi:hypothetical protein